MATKYLKYFPEPLLEDFLRNRWLPIIGAGMSLNAKLPPPKKMPLWRDLGDAIAKGLTNFQAANPLDAISAYEHEFGRPKLIEKFMELLHVREAAPGDVHRAFCSIPFDLVCTTNFDFILERQYDSISHHAHPVVDEDQLSINIAGPGTTLLKLHGDLRHPSRLVATEDDYDRFLANYPLIATYLANQLITKTAILVGYSLDDPDFRQIWALISNRLGKSRRVAYSIMVGAHASEIARFDRRGVKVINLPGSKEKYGDVLAGAFDELREYKRDRFVATSEVTEEKPLQELKLPRGTANRLCFFAVPVDLLSLYRSRVFPILEQVGVVPVTTDDIVSAGDSINATIDALVDRAAAVVVDLGLKWRNAAYVLAAAHASQKDASQGKWNSKVLIVSADMPIADSPLNILEAYTIINRANLLDENVEHFAHQLASNLQAIMGTSASAQQQHEAQRLLDSGEYRAAVIAAMTLLEAWLNERVRAQALSYDFRSPTIRRLLDSARSADLVHVTDEQYKRILEWIATRNEAVHTDRPVSRTVAREIVDGVLRIVRRA